MATNFELSKYEFDDYYVFRLESSKDQDINPDQMGFAIIEFKSHIVSCSKCNENIYAVQTWWHNKLPFSYISGQEKGINFHLCLDCAVENNNFNIILLKKDESEDEKERNLKLLEQYEIENEQIEYYKLYKEEQSKVLTNQN